MKLSTLLLSLTTLVSASLALILAPATPAQQAFDRLKKLEGTWEGKAGAGDSIQDTKVIYKVTAPYDKAAERGVIWNDSDIGIAWPVRPGTSYSITGRSVARATSVKWCRMPAGPGLL